jgi:hypothetical protein
VDGEPPARRIPLRQQAARFHRQRHVPLHPEALAARIGGIPAGRGGIAQHGVKLDREIAAGFLEQERFVLRGGVPVRHRRQLLDVDLDRLQGVLGERRAFRQHQRKRLAHIADLGMGDHRLGERLELRQRLQPHRHLRDRAAEVGCRDDAVHAQHCQRARGIDRSNAAMGDCAAQDRGMQQAGAGEIIHIFAAAAQETQILQPFDRAADERVDGPHG